MTVHLCFIFYYLDILSPFHLVIKLHGLGPAAASVFPSCSKPVYSLGALRGPAGSALPFCLLRGVQHQATKQTCHLHFIAHVVRLE